MIIKTYKGLPKKGDNMKVILNSDIKGVGKKNEIINASEDLKVDFVTNKMIPLVDCGENDFIVYHFDTKKWSMYNIIDNCAFMERESLEGLLN